ncbi:MAG: alcohol dehydrogenase catalytic domain-containing protein [Candidatus Atribacteria bacterium]|nr:alcohol dehydrogenase catalytic domain-containing protein [Candidatus Atribacteria bacterium]
MASIESMGNVPKKMKAVVNYGPRDFRLEEVDVPEIDSEEILLKVGGCGICAGDVKTFYGAPRVWGSPGQPASITTPVIPGHEFYGQIVTLGKGAKEKYQVSLGDWVVSEQRVPCEKCRYCLQGKYWMCTAHQVYGFQHRTAEGGFADYIRLPKTARNYKLPEGFPLPSAPFIEPLACGIHAVERADIQFADVVVIAGIGPLGLGMLQSAKLKNPKLLIVIDIKKRRLELGKKLGADLVMNQLEENVVLKVKELTNGYGCDVYIQASGHPQGVIQGLQMTRKLGRYVEFSVYSEPTLVDWSIIGDVKELDIRGVHLSPYTYPTAIRLLQKGLVKTEDIITHRLLLSEYKKGMELTEKGDESIKVVLVP